MILKHIMTGKHKRAVRYICCNGRSGVAVNFFMLKATIVVALLNSLVYSVLRNVPFRFPERAVSGGKMWPFAAQKGTFGNAKWHIREIKARIVDFNCIFAGLSSRCASIKAVPVALCLLAVSLLQMSCSEKGGGQPVATSKVTVDKTFPLTPDGNGPSCKVRMEVVCFTGNDTLSKKMNGAVEQIVFETSGLGIARAADSLANMCGRDYVDGLTPFYNKDSGDESRRKWYEYSYAINTEAKEERPGFLTYFATKRFFEGGAHDVCLTITVNFNKKTGSVVRLGDLFVQGYEKGLGALLLGKLQEKTGAKDLEELHDKGYLLTTDMFPSDNFVLTDGGITFIYNPYEIAPYEVGSTELHIENKEIKNLLKQS